NNSLVTIVTQSVPAFFRTLLRPFILESKEPLVFISALENLLILLFSLVVMFTWRKGSWNENPLFYFSLSFFVLIFMLIGLLVPVTGAIVRYKIVALPFLTYLLFYLSDNSLLGKLLKRFSL
ncbi:MAG: hypothetical protein JJE25_06510, partial [Bacteroidia bacterium]|nr:hypothetical protein [Bacteroidia bacterium]